MAAWAAGAAVVLWVLSVILGSPAAGEPRGAVQHPGAVKQAGAVQVQRGRPSAIERGPAVLLSSNPAALAVLGRRPAEVILHFDRPVAINPSSIRVLADGGADVSAGPAFHPGGVSAAIGERLRPLPPGVYLVSWQLNGEGAEESGGRASGGYWFTLLGPGASAHPPTSTGSVRSILAALDAPEPSGTVSFLDWLTRFLGTVATLVLVGVGAAFSVVWPEGWSRRWSIPLTLAACGTLVLATLAETGLNGLARARLPLSHLFSRSLYADALRTSSGRADLAIWVLAIVAGLLLQLLDQRFRRGDVAPRRWWMLTAGLVGVGLVTASVVAGPARSGRWPAVGFVAGTVHLGAAAVWLGAFLVLIAALRADSPLPNPGTAARSLSRLALWAVLALAASGAVEAAREGGGLDGLTMTAYGHLLVIKSILALAAVLIALSGARWVRSRNEQKSTRSRRLVLGSALAEVVLLTGALGVAAALVGHEPAEQALSEPYGHVFAIGRTDVNVILDPGRVGADNTLHIYTLRRNGDPVGILEIGGVMRLPSAGIGPITIPLINAGLAHFIALDIDLPVAGNWQLALTVHTGLASKVPIVTTVPIH